MSTSIFPPASIPSWFSNQLYLHSTNQPSLLGAYSTSSPITSSYHSTTLDSRDPTPSTPSVPEAPTPSQPSPLPSLSSRPTYIIPISTTCQPSQPVNTHPMQTRSKCGISNQIPSFVTKLLWTIPSLNHLPTELHLNTPSGVRLWMLNFLLFKGSILGLLFQLLLM